MTLAFVIESSPAQAAFNMALDEALLEAMPRLGIPVLRFYSWSEPAASFGYFQKYEEVARATRLRPLVRRPTAGGMVPHDADWTYSVAFPTSHAWYSLRAVESYRRIHEWVRSAFARLGIATELADCRRGGGAGQCFLGYELSDVLWHGRKIAGAAQRRTRTGLLIQGSVQSAPLGLSQAGWQKAMRQIGEREQGLQWREFAPDAFLNERALTLSRTKYSQAAYNQKR
jgi:lipoyl(octanoyl) transferase